jgi:nucleotide-binding universal stress UspA family protein
MTEREASGPLALDSGRRSIERMLDLGSAKSPARVLFATSAEQPAADTMQRALELVQTVKAEMHILYVASDLGRATKLELIALTHGPARASIPPDTADATLSIQLQNVTPAESASLERDNGVAAATMLETISTHTGTDRLAQRPPSPVGALAAESGSSTAGTPSSGDALSRGRAVPAWCKHIIPEAQVSTRVSVRSGDFVATVCEHAEALGAALLIVSGHEQPGGRITALSRQSGRPVFVARTRPIDSNKVLAATDLSDERFPVLRLAYKFGGFLHAPLVAVHNVPPKSLEAPTRSRRQAPDPDFVATTGLQALVDVTRSLGYETAVLSCMFDPVDAVLREARARRADTIMVGTHEPRAGERISVAAQIVNLASQSVLVVPLDHLESTATRAPQPTISLSTAEAI